MSGVIRVLIAEPDAPTRLGIRLALVADGLEVCAEPVTAMTGPRERDDVCLIDDDLPGGATVAVDAIYRAMPDCKVVILTDSEEPKSLFAAVRAGASGYMRRDLDPA